MDLVSVCLFVCLFFPVRRPSLRPRTRTSVRGVITFFIFMIFGVYVVVVELGSFSMLNSHKLNSLRKNCVPLPSLGAGCFDIWNWDSFCVNWLSCVWGLDWGYRDFSLYLYLSWNSIEGDCICLPSLVVVS
jgi:hypothetical protein